MTYVIETQTVDESPEQARVTALKAMLLRWTAIEHVLGGGSPDVLEPAALEQLKKVQMINRHVVQGLPPLTREEAEAEIPEAMRTVVEAKERQRQDEAERQARERAEHARQLRLAHERAAEAAADAQKFEERRNAALIDLRAAQSSLQAAAAAFSAALASVGNVSLHSGLLTAAHRKLLEQLGPDADAARRALPEGHPARL